MAWYETAEDDGGWDTRTNTLTFHTFRPISPDDLTAVSGVTPQMFNGTLERRRQLGRTSMDSNLNGPSSSITDHQYNNHCPTHCPPNRSHCPLDTTNAISIYRGCDGPIGGNRRQLAVVHRSHVCNQQGSAEMLGEAGRPVNVLHNSQSMGNSCGDGGKPAGPTAVKFITTPKVLVQYQELLIDILLCPDETLAGFSMTSTSNKAPVCVYRIMKGSAAERSGLEVNDEILEINGESVVSSTHDEIIDLIQKCIKSRTIRLKVRRRLSNENSPSSNGSCHNSASVGSESETSSSGTGKNRLSLEETRIDAPHQYRIEGYTKLESAPELRHNERISDAYLVVSDPNGKAALISEISQRFPNARTVDMMESVETSPAKPAHTNGGNIQNHQRHNHSHHNNQQGQHGHTVVNNGAFVAVPNGARIVTPGQQQHEEQETSFIVDDGNTVVVKNTTAVCGQPTVLSVGQYYGGSKTNLSRGMDHNAETDERLKRYENDLQKRREIDEQKAKEAEFLRSSIRGSKKLQALEKNGGQREGHANDGYMEYRSDEDDDEGEEENGKTRNGGGTRANGCHPDVALDDVLMSVNRLTGALDRSPQYRGHSEFLRDLFSDKSVRSAIEVTAIAEQHWGRPHPANFKPAVEGVVELLNSLMKQLDQSNSLITAELLSILETPAFQALLRAHDKTAEIVRDVQPSTSQNSINESFAGGGLKETQFDSGSAGDLRIVKLVKNGDNPLGATVVQEGKTIVIGRVIKGGVAEKSGLIREGDELLEVNGVDLRAKSVHEVCTILADMQGELTFIIAPNPNSETTTDDSVATVRHMRALFDYDPEDDSYLPCRELGLSFRKGDILHVISMSDTNWWQAHRDGEENCHLAGLIPSDTFQIQRERYRLEVSKNGHRSVRASRPSKVVDGQSEPALGGLWCARRKSKPKTPSKTFVFGNSVPHRRWSAQGCDGNEEEEEEDILTYEEVTLHLSRAGTRRPVVLVGPTNVGCLQLRQKLMEMEKEKFAGAVPHTSRPRKADEQDGVHYHFVTRQQFQQGVAARKFVEWGEYQKHFYGTSFDAIRRVIERGKTCALTLKPQSVKALRNSDLMPFVVFISPPSFERLKANKQREMGVMKEEELKNIINEAKIMEREFGHYFDKTIINYDLERSFQELRTDIHRLETEPQWVSVDWLKRQRQH